MCSLPTLPACTMRTCGALELGRRVELLSFSADLGLSRGVPAGRGATNGRNCCSAGGCSRAAPLEEICIRKSSPVIHTHRIDCRPDHGLMSRL